MNETWTLSVTQLNDYVRKMIAGDPLLRGIRVEGELSGFKRHFSGHLYFTLKDENARVQCVMFRADAAALDFQPSDGMRVVVSGSASLYAQTGAFQIYADSMTRQGVGDLYLKFERLKRRLADEGLFDPALKREIPAFPRTIGVVTSRTGAVLRDIVRVAHRRNPRVGILVAPSSVQGAGAAQEIAEAIELLNRQGEAEVILCGRGGGSIEDLWPFNEEIVARAIRASRIPVISCVGHETDFTIADFAADLRAPTPSAAAELAVPEAGALRDRLEEDVVRLNRALSGVIRLDRMRLNHLKESDVLSCPVKSLIGDRRKSLERLMDAPCFVQPEKTLIGERRHRLEKLATSSAFDWPKKLPEKRYQLEKNRLRLNAAMEKPRAAAASRLELLTRALNAVNPSAVLERGYAVVKRDGRALSDAAALRDGAPVQIVLRDGGVDA